MYEILIGEHLPDSPGALQQGKTPVNYDRQQALAYALFFCNRVCSDGVLMSGTHLNRRKAGALLADVDPVDDENDCTHFISCALGAPPPFKAPDGTKLTGGGIFLSPAGFHEQGTSGVYGILEPSPLVVFLRETRKVAFAHVDGGGVLSFHQMQPQFFKNTQAQVDQLAGLIKGRFSGDQGKGDLIAYFGDPQKPGRHAALLVSDDWGITCHTGSRCGSQPVTDVGWENFIYLRFKEYKEEVL